MPSFGDGCDRAVNRPARSVTGCRTGVSRPRLSSQYSSRPLRSYSGPPARTAHRGRSVSVDATRFRRRPKSRFSTGNSEGHFGDDGTEVSSGECSSTQPWTLRLDVSGRDRRQRHLPAALRGQDPVIWILGRYFGTVTRKLAPCSML